MLFFISKIDKHMRLSVSGTMQPRDIGTIYNYNIYGGRDYLYNIQYHVHLYDTMYSYI